jgi:hypothetical protein
LAASSRCASQRIPVFPAIHLAPGAGAALAFKVGEYHVFRAAVLSIALTLAVSQNAGLLCKVWCHPSEAACEHPDQTTSLSVTGDDNCMNITVGAIAFVREELRRGESAPDTEPAVTIPSFRFAPPLTGIRFDHGPGQPSRLATHPLVIALRI